MLLGLDLFNLSNFSCRVKKFGFRSWIMTGYFPTCVPEIWGFGLLFHSFLLFLGIPGKWQWSTPPPRPPQVQFAGTHFAGECGIFIYLFRDTGYEEEGNRMCFYPLTSARGSNSENSENLNRFSFFLFNFFFSLRAICLCFKIKTKS